jgi:hypothetical protein
MKTELLILKSHPEHAAAASFYASYMENFFETSASNYL